jgi:hypothetical protein
MPALAEIVHLLETRLGHHVMNAFLEDIKSGLFCLDFATTDIARAQEMANKYQNLPLGLTDAFVIACAERNGGAVLSLDEHFWNSVWRGEAENALARVRWSVSRECAFGYGKARISRKKVSFNCMVSKNLPEII